MGFFKKIKKAVKKTISNPVNVVKQVASGDVKGAIKTAAMAPVDDVKGSLDIAKEAAKEVGNGFTALKNAVVPKSPNVNQASDPTQINASDVAAPDKEEAEGDTDGDTASEIKKNRSTGKKSLTVARTSGGGVNI